VLKYSSYGGNMFCKNKVDIEKPFKPTEITRKEAQEKYPEWYVRVIEPQIERIRLEREL
jgi:hypothetical protein